MRVPVTPVTATRSRGRCPVVDPSACRVSNQLGEPVDVLLLCDFG